MDRDPEKGPWPFLGFISSSGMLYQSAREKYDRTKRSLAFRLLYMFVLGNQVAGA